MGQGADGDHGHFVLLVLGILARDFGEVSRLTLEPELEGLGARGFAARIARDLARELLLAHGMGERGANETNTYEGNTIKKLAHVKKSFMQAIKPRFA